MKTYAIGDLHGRFDLLTQAIDIIEADSPEGGRLVVLGDFVDRGHHSKSIIEFLMTGPKTPGWEWIVLQGNHEAMMLQCLESPGILRWWIGNGGGRTLQSYGYQDGDDLFPLKMPQNHLDWLQSLPLTFEDDRRIFVHAGVPFDQMIKKTSAQTLQWMIYDDPEDEHHYSDAEYHPGIGGHVSGKWIVHGHHQDAANPRPRPGRTNLDSFAWFTGRTAIGVFDETQGREIKVLEAKGPPAK